MMRQLVSANRQFTPRRGLHRNASSVWHVCPSAFQIRYATAHQSMHLISRSSYSSRSPCWRSLSRLCQRWNEMVTATASVTPMSSSWCPTRQGRCQDISWPRDLPSRSSLKSPSSRRVSWSPKKVSWPPWSANDLAQFQHRKTKKDITNVVMNFEATIMRNPDGNKSTVQILMFESLKWNSALDPIL